MKKIDWWEVVIAFAATLAMAIVLISCMEKPLSNPRESIVVDTASDDNAYILSLSGADIQSAKIIGSYTPNDVRIDAEKLRDDISMMVVCGEGYLSIGLTMQPFTGTLETLRLTGARITLDSVELTSSRHECAEGSYSMEEIK